MDATSFDALAVARKLEAAGMANGQAVAVAEAIRDAQADLVTKAHLDSALAELEGRQNAKFAEFEGRQNAKFAELEGRFVALEGRLDAKFAELRADFAEKQAAIYRALWLQGASIIAVFTALYALFGRPV